MTVRATVRVTDRATVRVTVRVTYRVTDPVSGAREPGAAPAHPAAASESLDAPPEPTFWVTRKRLGWRQYSSCTALRPSAAASDAQAAAANGAAAGRTSCGSFSTRRISPGPAPARHLTAVTGGLSDLGRPSKTSPRPSPPPPGPAELLRGVTRG